MLQQEYQPAYPAFKELISEKWTPTDLDNGTRFHHLGNIFKNSECSLRKLSNVKNARPTISKNPTIMKMEDQWACNDTLPHNKRR